MEKYYNVSEGAVLSCTLGTSSSPLCIPDSHGVSIGSRAEATTNDYKGGVNILSFGRCTKRYPTTVCQPVILSPWLLGNKGYEINGETVLMSNSILSCACGGIIKIQSK